MARIKKMPPMSPVAKMIPAKTAPSVAGKAGGMTTAKKKGKGGKKGGC